MAGLTEGRTGLVPDPRDSALREIRDARRMIGRDDVAVVHGLSAVAYALLAVNETIEALVARVEEVER
jgi:hypothetical protein